MKLDEKNNSPYLFSNKKKEREIILIMRNQSLEAKLLE